MEVLAFVIIWPFLIFAVAVSFIAFADLNFANWWILFLVIGLFLVSPFKRAIKGDKLAISTLEQLEVIRQTSITFALALLAPVFIRYLIEAFNTSLVAVIGGLVYGFVLVVWGMFTKNNRVIAWGNIAGGAFALLYVYSQLWQLGELARVYAAGFGLVVAVAISIIKLKNRLTS